jgi:hypothetical protein
MADHDYVDSITFTVAEAEDLVAALRWAIANGAGPHALPADQQGNEMGGAQVKLEMILGKIERPLKRAQDRRVRLGRKG